MAVLEHEVLMQNLQNIIGDRDDDEALAILTDTRDTLASTQGDGTDWKTRYEENDAAWRKKYKDAFFGTPVPPDPPADPVPPDTGKVKFEDLFKEG